MTCRHATHLALLVLAVLSGSACHFHQRPEAPSVSPHSEPKAQKPPTSPPARRPLGLLLEQLPAGSLGPHLAATSAGWVTVAATEEEGEGSLHSTFLPSTSFEPTSAELAPPSRLVLGPAPAGLRRFSLHPDTSGGLTVLQVHAGSPGEQLSWLSLGSSGELRSDRALLSTSPVPIVWETVLIGGATSDPQVQGLALYAERQKDAADVYAVALRRGSSAEPKLVAQEVLAWQALHWQGQNLVALTRRQAASVRIEVVRLDAHGQLIAAPTVIATELEGGYEMDLVADGDRLQIVWTELNEGSLRLWGSSLNVGGEVTPVRPLTPPRLTQRLIRSIAEGDSMASGNARGAALAWTEPDLSEPGLAPLLVAPLADLDDTLAIAHRGHDPLLPALARAGGNTWGMFEGQRCEPEAECTAPDLFAFSSGPGGAGVQGLSSVLTTLGRRELRAAQAWDLTCSGSDGICLALVADGGTPASVFVVALSHLDWASSSLVEQQPRRVAAAQDLMAVPELSSLSVWTQETDNRVYGAWLSFFDPSEPYRTPSRPAPDGRRAPVRARLESFVLSRLSATFPPAQGADAASSRPASTDLSAGRRTLSDSPTAGSVVSYRARSLGGVAFAPAPGGGGVLAWAAIDGTEPQLFATLLDASGKKARQSMLTRQRGEVTDVSVVAVDRGWVFAWVGGPSGEEEVHALLVDERLSARTPVQISSGAVNPTGLSLIRFGDSLVVVWADARTATQPGRADLFLARLALDGTLQDRPTSLVSKEAHLHSPRLAVQKTEQGERLALAYIESQGSTLGAKSSVRAADLVVQGRGRVHALLVDEPASEVAWGPASTASFDWKCEGDSCWLAAAAATDASAQLWTGQWTGDSEPEAALLLHLGTRAAEASLPRWVGDELVYADETEQGWVLRRVVGQRFHSRFAPDRQPR